MSQLLAGRMPDQFPIEDIIVWQNPNAPSLVDGSTVGDLARFGFGLEGIEPPKTNESPGLLGGDENDWRPAVGFIESDAAPLVDNTVPRLAGSGDKPNGEQSETRPEPTPQRRNGGQSPETSPSGPNGGSDGGSSR